MGLAGQHGTRASSDTKPSAALSAIDDLELIIVQLIVLCACCLTPSRVQDFCSPPSQRLG